MTPGDRAIAWCNQHREQCFVTVECHAAGRCCPECEGVAEAVAAERERAVAAVQSRRDTGPVDDGDRDAESYIIGWNEALAAAVAAIRGGALPPPATVLTNCEFCGNAPPAGGADAH